MIKIISGLATGIGSLPFKDAKKAVDLILEKLPEIPFWPQLPMRDVCEGMLAQFSEHLPCLKMTADGLYFDPLSQDEQLEDFYEQIIGNNLDYFKISENFALGLYEFFEALEKKDLGQVQFIKCHVTGPFTFTAGLNDAEGVALLHNPVFKQAFFKGLEMKALWQIKFFEKFNKKIIIFIDEPYLGCFGSAYTALNKQDVVRDLAEWTAGIKSENTLIGAHCCGNTDWSIFTDVKSIDIINFDAFNYLDKIALYSDSLKGFLSKGGILCWGIVPTQEWMPWQKPELLADKIKEGVDMLAGKGLDKRLLTKNLLISPACGLGTLEEDKSEQIINALSLASIAIRNSTTK